tara:strand:- start:69 stop:362 length:294 start_codon:yes stop_codon:yes gene_type:complete
MAEMQVLQEQKTARFALSGSYTLETLIFPDRATHRPSLAGATCPSPFGQVGNLFAFCGEPRGAVLWQPHCLISKFTSNLNFMSLTKIQRQICIEKWY